MGLWTVNGETRLIGALVIHHIDHLPFLICHSNK